LPADEGVRVEFHRGVEIITIYHEQAKPGFYLHAQLLPEIRRVEMKRASIDPRSSWVKVVDDAPEMADGHEMEPEDEDGLEVVPRTQYLYTEVLPPYRVLINGVVIVSERVLGMLKGAIDVSWRRWAEEREESIGMSLEGRVVARVNTSGRVSDKKHLPGCEGWVVATGERLHESECVVTVRPLHSLRPLSNHLDMTELELMNIFHSTLGREVSFLGATYTAMARRGCLHVLLAPTETKKTPVEVVMKAVRDAMRRITMGPIEGLILPDPPLEGRVSPGATYLSYSNGPRDWMEKIIGAYSEGYTITTLLHPARVDEGVGFARGR
jgi:hypothetical protein